MYLDMQEYDNCSIAFQCIVFCKIQFKISFVITIYSHVQICHFLNCYMYLISIKQKMKTRN